MTNFVTPGPTSTGARNIFRVLCAFTINANEFHKNYALKNAQSELESAAHLLKVRRKSVAFPVMTKVHVLL